MTGIFLTNLLIYCEIHYLFINVCLQRKFNLLIWLCEVISGVVIFLPGSALLIQLTRIAYFTIPNTVSPILYYIGIDLNRQEFKKYVMTIFKEAQMRGSKVIPLNEEPKFL